MNVIIRTSGSGGFDSLESYWDRIYFKVFGEINLTGMVVLDLGCGYGDLSKRIARNSKDVIGIGVEDDFNTTSNDNIEFRKMNAEKMEFTESYFDIVFAKDALHHIENLGLVFGEIRRVLKPGGILIIVEANRYNPLFYINTTKRAKHNHFSTGYLKLLLETNGYDDYRHRFIHTRDYRVNNGFLHRVTGLYDRFVEAVPLIKMFCTYNVFYVKNPND